MSKRAPKKTAKRRPLTMRRARIAIARVEVGFCQLYFSTAIDCPRCKVHVPAHTHHRCGTESPA